MMQQFLICKLNQLGEFDPLWLCLRCNQGYVIQKYFNKNITRTEQERSGGNVRAPKDLCRHQNHIFHLAKSPSTPVYVFGVQCGTSPQLRFADSTLESAAIR